MEKQLYTISRYALNKGPIVLFVILFLISVYFLIKYFTGFRLFGDKDLADRYYSRKDNFKLRTKKNFEDRINDLINAIIRFKRNHKLYGISEMEEERRNKLLERFYLLKVDRAMNWKTFDAQNCIVFFLCLIGCILSFIIFRNTFVSSLLLLLSYWTIFSGRFKKIEMYINRQNDRMEYAFGDFFLTQYRILLSSHMKPLERGLNVYKKICYQPDMLEFTNIALYLVYNMGEEQAIEKLTQLYSDIGHLTKLLMIEQQLIRGSQSIENELLGIRTEVLKEKENQIEIKCALITRESNVIVYAVFFVVIQVCLGAIVYVIQQSGILKG